MKTSSSSSSSVFAPYTKEESTQRMQLKRIHQQLQHSKQQASQQPEKPSASASTTTAPESTNSSCTTTPVRIPYNIDWIFKRLKNPNGFWYFCSQIAILTVGLFSKIVLGKLQVVLSISVNFCYIGFHFISFHIIFNHTHAFIVICTYICTYILLYIKLIIFCIRLF